MVDDARSGPVVDRVVALVSPILADLGLDLYDCEFAGGILRVTVDKPGASVDLDEISLATRLVSTELDHVDVVPGRYTLEVSSPGLERHLRQPSHYQWAIGRDAVVRLRDVPTTERRLAGRVLAADDEGIDFEPTEGLGRGTSIRVSYGDIDRAKTVFIWAANPKPTGAKRKPTVTGTNIEDSQQEVAAS